MNPNEIAKLQSCKVGKGPFIKDVINQGGGEGFAKRWSYLISLFSKSDDEGGRGVKNLKKLMTSFMNGSKQESVRHVKVN